MIICHLNKSPGGTPVYRIGGSIGVVAAARTALLVATDPLDKDQRILAVLKSNLGAFPQSVVFRMENDPETGAVHLKWVEFSPITAADLLKSGEKTGRVSAIAEAEAFLDEILTDGSVPAEEVKAAAEERGIAETTLQRAKRSRSVISSRRGFGKGGASYWSLPDDGANQTAGDSPESPHR